MRRRRGKATGVSAAVCAHTVLWLFSSASAIPTLQTNVVYACMRVWGMRVCVYGVNNEYEYRSAAHSRITASIGSHTSTLALIAVAHIS